ncbi:HAD family hydrolase, partial [Pleurocapsales cyanobacterium LEGE 10410]|nr:HAD family hydrolase [Pleurocapsales cyanobacterium LEGE 10410]
SDNGLESATAAGLTTLVTVNNYTENQDFTRAALVVSDLGEPNLPCKVLRGDLTGNFLDLASLRSLLNRR